MRRGVTIGPARASRQRARAGPIRGHPSEDLMALSDVLFGRRLASLEEEDQRVGVLAGIPMLGLDALASAAYGPEAALTLLIPLSVGGVRYIGPITTLIIALLLVVYFSYRQTIAAYPSGGGSYTVARENLGHFWGLLAAAALLLDYVLTVSVGISAGVGALISAVPELHPHILALCLGTLVLTALLNLRGIRESGAVFMIPTYLFFLCMAAVLGYGFIQTLLQGGHPSPVVAPLEIAPQASEGFSLWLLTR